MQNPLFEDFLDMDLLGPSAESNDLFSYFLNPTENGEMDLTDAAAAHVDSPTMSNASMSSPMDMALPIKFEEDDEAESRKLMLMDIDSCSPDLAMLKREQEESAIGGIVQDSTVLAVDFGGDAMCLTTQLMDPTHFAIKPEATVNPSATIVTIAPAATTISTSAAAATSLNKKAVTVDASKSASMTPSKRGSPEPASSTKKRSSPEPTASTRKHAKSESVSSKAKAGTSRKSSIFTTSSTSSSSASSSSSSSSPSTTASTSVTTTSLVDNASAESLTSTANTTLSAATLQFLLQQQMQTPLIPQLFTGTLTREEIEATLARLLESTKHLIQTPDESDQIKIKEEAASDDESDVDLEHAEAEGAEQTHGLKTQPGIKTDDIPSSTDLKKMTSKERRQLRNKISARNFRVRRKEYIYTLEGQVLQHKTEARHLREAVTLVQEENQRLKDELEQVKLQLTQATISGGSVGIEASPAPLSKENQTLLSAIMNRSVTSALSPNAKSNLTLSMARPQSPILTPNYHKDVPNSTSGTTSSTAWKDKNPTMVHTTLVPEICFDNEFQFGQKLAQPMDDNMLNRPWLNMNAAHNPTTSTSPNPFWMSGLALEVMVTFTAMTLGITPVMVKTKEEEQDTRLSVPDMESTLDWELQQNMWALAETSVIQQEEDVEEDEEVQLLYHFATAPLTSPLDEALQTTRPMSPASLQEDPNMLEWLYESMMARLVDLDLQGTQDHVYNPVSDPHSA
ncbi:hypothetical protein CPC16_006762 [Podila verticillata]|nr:hypothetical protein BGZ52_001729 [Haplosporangium bisporale]KAF9387971.1 hypothetical protein CPC16_006762 [Podila verticillata]KFH65680.1 hypothetical protein MVEG_09153 [Podila verticillata NRRL 6337]